MVSAYAGLDPRSGAAIPPDYIVEQGVKRYTAVDHDIWRFLFRRQHDLLQGRAVGEFHDGLRALGIGEGRIPDFDDVNDRLSATTGWRIAPVPGLVPDSVFFAHLAAQRFPAGYWIRTPQELDYIEEPDVFHDVFGHAPLLMQPRYADYMQAYGAAGLRLAGADRLKRLSRLYWYTTEFGLMRDHNGLRIFGAGILSSAAEAVYALESPLPRRIAFDCIRVMRTAYEIDHLQDIYFVLSGYGDLPRLDPAWLDQALAAAETGIELGPRDLDPRDRCMPTPGAGP